MWSGWINHQLCEINEFKAFVNSLPIANVERVVRLIKDYKGGILVENSRQDILFAIQVLK